MAAIRAQGRLVSMLDRLEAGPCRRDRLSDACLSELDAASRFAEGLIADWAAVGPPLSALASGWPASVRAAIDRYRSTRTHRPGDAERMLRQLHALEVAAHLRQDGVLVRGVGPKVGPSQAERLRQALDSEGK